MASFRDLPLRAKGLIVISIPITALLLVVSAFYFVQRGAQDAESWVRHTVEVRSAIQTAGNRWQMAEASALGYLATRNPQWLEPFRQARQELPGIFDRLKRMVADNPEQAARIRRLEEAVAGRMDQLEELPARASALASPADADSLLHDARVAQTTVRSGFASILDAEDRLLAQRSDRATSIRNWGYAVIAAGLILAPAGAVLAVLLFASAIVRRVEALERNAHLLAAGHPVRPAAKAKDEIGGLEGSLIEAAELLQERQGELRRAAADLEVRVEMRTAELARANEALEGEILERKRAQDGLGDALQKLKAVIDGSPLAIIGLDVNDRVVEWNRAAHELFGWTSEETVSRRLPVIPEGGSIKTILDGGSPDESTSAFDTQLRRKDGSLVDVRLWTAPLRSALGQVRGRMAIVADMSQQRRLEDQFAQAQKMEAIGRLAGGVAHDFNNVITVVSGYGHMILDAVQKDPPLREAAEEVLKSADRAAALASQLLAFSRRQVIQPRLLDLNELVRNMHRMLSRVIGEDVDLKTVLAGDVAAVRADPGQLEQVIMNLAVNARDAMPHGGKLTIETANTVLDETYARNHTGVQAGGFVMLAVTDNGTGMDANTRAHLFEPFYTTKEKGKGTGLGLSTVYGIVKQHGGDIWVYSEPGRGTTLKVYLPQASAGSKTEEDLTRKMPARHGSECILLVEDEDGVRRLVRDILEQRGYKVIEAASGEEALEMSGDVHEKLDLLVTDVVMPKMSGRDLAEALALLKPDLKVLFLSGYTDQVVVDHGILNSSSEFLQKPFTPETLAHKVREVLDQPAKKSMS